ncbi:MAG: YbjQ family protein [Granulosicoccus sp.]
MLVSNLEFLPGRKVNKHLGLVQGSSVRSKHVGRDIAASLKNIFGGELRGYTELLSDSREEATQRMLEQASSIGANAVLNIRYSTSSIASGAAEIFVYGTAVELAEEDVTHD